MRYDCKYGSFPYGQAAYGVGIVTRLLDIVRSFVTGLTITSSISGGGL